MVGAVLQWYNEKNVRNMAGNYLLPNNCLATDLTYSRGKNVIQKRTTN